MAVMFVDNSGVDIVLGVFPFVRELLSRGTVVSVTPNISCFLLIYFKLYVMLLSDNTLSYQVVLAANSHPALNDVTYSELLIIADKVAAICPMMK